MEMNKQERRMLKLFRSCSEIQKILILDATEEMVASQSIPTMSAPCKEALPGKSNVLPFRRKNA